MNKKEAAEVFSIIVVLVSIISVMIFLVLPTKYEAVNATVLGTRTGRLSVDYYVIISTKEFGVVPVKIGAEEYFYGSYVVGTSLTVSCRSETKAGPTECKIDD